jgi:hypothetical protein
VSLNGKGSDCKSEGFPIVGSIPTTFIYILSYLILSYLILSYLILSYLLLSYLLLSSLILSYFIFSYLLLSYLILSYLILSYIILSSLSCDILLTLHPLATVKCLTLTIYKNMNKYTFLNRNIKFYYTNEVYNNLGICGTYFLFFSFLSFYFLFFSFFSFLSFLSFYSRYFAILLTPK